MHIKSLVVSAGAVAMLALPVAAPVFASDSEHGTVAKPAKALNVACVATAVGKREDAMLAAFDKRNTATHSALVQRKTDLTAAWAKTNRAERNKAIRAAWATYEKSAKAARITFRSERNAAWKTFETARKACGGSLGETADLSAMKFDSEL
jgi:hypothetical protein